VSRWATAYDAWTRRLSRAAAYIGAVGIVVIMLATVSDVLRRWVQGRSVPGVVEGSELVLVVSVFLGLGLAERMGVHVSTSVVTDRLPTRVAGMLNAIGLVVVFLFLVWILAASADRALRSYISGEYRFGLMQIPLWPGRTAIAVGFLVLLLEVARHIGVSVLRARRRRRPDDAAASDVPAAI
jgi:TRAP-type C4-dicarboxylate transport system permease small subunit